MEKFNPEEEERKIYNSKIEDYVTRKLGELQGLPIVLHYTGDIDCFFVIISTHIATIQCKDRRIHYIKVYGDNEQGEEVDIDIDISKIQFIDGEVKPDETDMISIYMQNDNLISIEYN